MKPILRYFGSKHKASKHLIPMLPKHTIYCEPYGGSAGLLMNKPPCAIEYYNEIDPRIYNLFRVIKDKRSMLQLCEQLRQVTWCKQVWEDAFEIADDPVIDALNVLIRSWMSFSPVGIFRQNSGYRDGAYDKTNVSSGHQTIWNNLPTRIKFAHKRFQFCHLSNLDAITFLDIIERHHGEHAFIYVDPPYLHTTRCETKGYSSELSQEDHAVLLDKLQTASANVLLSGYENSLYQSILVDWKVKRFQTCIASKRGGSSKSEMVWFNYQQLHYTEQIDLIDSSNLNKPLSQP